MARDDLAEFVRVRRERLVPEDPEDGTRRRTPGLRREEVAELAHMSVDYLVRIEQARGPHPSTGILEGLSEALRLDEADRLHLFRLAERTPPPPEAPPRAVRPYLRDLLDRMHDAAVIVTAASYDVVAHNQLAGRLLGHLDEEPNLARRRFLEGRHWSAGAEDFGGVAVARLRAAAQRYPRDERLAELVRELRAGSPEFARLWREHPVHLPGHRVKTVDHPEVGRFEVSCDVLVVPEDDQQVVFVTAPPGSIAEQAFARLRAG